MADLEQLNATEGSSGTTLATLNGTEGNVEKKKRVPNSASNMQRAARSSLLIGDPENVVSNYRLMLSELEENGTSPTEDALLQQRKDEHKNRVNLTALDYLSDPTVSDEEKRIFMEQYADGSLSPFNSYDTMLTDNVVKPSPTVEKTVEGEKSRVGIADMLGSINRQQREAQKLSNQLATTWSGENTETFLEFAELLLPYTEWNQIRRIHNDFVDEEDRSDFMDSFLIGERKMDIREKLLSLPEDERNAALSKLLQIIDQNSEILLQDENDFASYQAIQDLIQGEYTTFDRTVDNITGVLDVVGLGGLARRPLEALGAAVGAMRNERIVSDVNPGSAAAASHQTNPDNAMAMHDSLSLEQKTVAEGNSEAVAEELEEAAQALYGTDRNEAVASDYVPSQTASDGSVKNRVHRVGRRSDERITPSADVMDFVERGGDIHFTKQEKEEMRSVVVNGFSEALGIRNRDEMLSVTNKPTGVSLSARYAPAESGFSKPQEAWEHTKFALRDYGITDDHLTLMRRNGTRYEKVEGDDLVDVWNNNVEGDYVVQVDYDYKFNPLDVANWMETDVKYNIFDRVSFLKGSQGKGSVNRLFLDPASTLDPLIVKGGSVAVERSAGLEKEMLDLGKEFTDIFIKLPEDRQSIVHDYIKQMNHEGFSPDYAKMRADGLRENEREALYKWKEYWDTHYTLENRDLATSLRNNGYQILEDVGSDTRLIGKPVGRQNFKGSVRAYDPVSGDVKTVSGSELKELYERGGSVYSLRRPSDFGTEESIDLVISENRAGSSYFRAINDSDTILNYRKGYYHVSYKAPWFIDEIVRDKSGKELYRRAVQVAGNRKDAEVATARMRSSTGKEYEYRTNKEEGISLDSDDYWDLVTSGGRSAQRVRGQRLEGADIPNSAVGDNAFILNPVDSMIQTAKNISRRTSMRGYLDTVKKRFMEQYGHLVQRSPVDKPYGDPSFPADSNQISARKGAASDKEIADARTTWEFITSLEHGYRNSIDDASKAILKSIAEQVGAKSTKAEDVVRAAGERADVSRQAKGVAFELYLALNPLRQIVVQSHQASLLAANFGKYGSDNIALLPKNMAQLGADTAALTLLQMNPSMVKAAAKIAGRSVDEVKAMFKDLNDSGITAGVSKNSLINDSLASLADEAAYNRNKTYLGQMRLFSQKAGFEAGERLNITSAWLAYRDRALREGKVFDAEVRDEVTAAARNYTYNMNAAGEMPYNKNMLATIFQFVQVPHKAMLQMTNRQLSRNEKLRLLGYQAVMFGLPAGFVYETLGDYLPDEPEVRDSLVQGLEGVTLNAMLSLLSDEEVEVYWKSLAPADMYGTYAFLESLFSTDITGLVANSPSGQLFIGNNPRIMNFVNSVARWTGFVDDYEEPTNFLMVMEDMARLTSGFSNLYKARMALKMEHKLNSMGNISDFHVTKAEAVMTAFGFQTMDEAKKYYISETRYRESSAWKEDLDKIYTEVKRHLAKKGASPKDMDYNNRVISMLYAAFPTENVQERQYLLGKMKKDSTQNLEESIFTDILRHGGMMDSESSTRGMINTLKDDESRKVLNGYVDHVEELRTQIREGN